MEKNNPGLIILDGPDASGKTTLARELLQGDEDGYVHLSYDSTWTNPDRMLVSIQRASIAKAIIRIKAGKLTVIDRHWMSEQIYARVYRAGSNLTPECRKWDELIQSVAGIYVVCSPLPSSAIARHRATLATRDEMYESDERIGMVAARYRDLFWGNKENKDDDYVGEITRTGGLWKRPSTLFYDIDQVGSRMKDFASAIKLTLRKTRALLK